MFLCLVVVQHFTSLIGTLVRGSDWSMSASGEDEVFCDTGASPVLRSPKLRRSTRTSSRKRASTGSLPYSRPRSKKKMQTVGSPPRAAAAFVAAATSVTPGAPEASTQAGPDGTSNPFASLGGGNPSAQPQGYFLVKMQEMMGGMLGGLEGRPDKSGRGLRL